MESIRGVDCDNCTGSRVARRKCVQSTRPPRCYHSARGTGAHFSYPDRLHRSSDDEHENGQSSMFVVEQLQGRVLEK